MTPKNKTKNWIIDWFESIYIIKSQSNKLSDQKSAELINSHVKIYGHLICHSLSKPLHQIKMIIIIVWSIHSVLPSMWTFILNYVGSMVDYKIPVEKHTMSTNEYTLCVRPKPKQKLLLLSIKKAKKGTWHIVALKHPNWIACSLMFPVNCCRLIIDTFIAAIKLRMRIFNFIE